MRRRAYKLLREDWSPKWQLELKRCWEKWHDYECALMIVDNLDPAYLVQHIDRLGEDLNSGGHVARLYLRACEVESGLLKKLRRLDGITFAYVSAQLSREISHRLAQQLLREYKHDSRLGILAWSLGKLGHWDLLSKLSAEVEDLDAELRRRQMKQWGMEYLDEDQPLNNGATESLLARSPATESS
jgi:hypothetical protein